jgi:hypothetical protein
VKKTFGVYVVEVFAFLSMIFGLGIVVIESVAHYRPYFTHKAAGAVLVPGWTVTPFVVGAAFFAFGGLILGYTIVKPALDEVEDASSFVTNLLQSVKFWGSRATDKVAATDEHAAAVVVAATNEHPVVIDPDKDKP